MVDSDPRTVLARAKPAMVEVPGPNTLANSSTVDGITPVGNTTWYTAPSVLVDFASASFAWLHRAPKPPTACSSERSPLDTSAESGAPTTSAQLKKKRQKSFHDTRQLHYHIKKEKRLLTSHGLRECREL